MYRYLAYRRSKAPLRWPVIVVLAAIAAVLLYAFKAHAAECRSQVYLTLDTGNMRHAELIAEILNKHKVRATFFLANEKTPRGDSSLDDSWAPYWRARAAEGHAFGSHTWRHGRFLGDLSDGVVRYRPQFGDAAGKVLMFSAQQTCAELKQVDETLRRMTGKALDPIWRAPGGYTTPNTLRAAQACGYAHVHWARAGFLGDELPSEQYPNAQLLQRALRDIRDGDVLMAHLGIWSRKDPFAPMLDPLIAGLKQRGFCFKTLREHSQFSAQPVPQQLAVNKAASK